MSVEQTDDELMARVAAGDDDAMQILVERWERPVQAFLTRMLGSIEDAQDLAGETFWRVWNNAGSYQARGQFKSWLFRIAGNQARSKLRRRKILQWVGFDPARHERPDAETPETVVEGEQTRAAVRRAIERLPDRQRQALVLRQYEHMSYRDIAETMNSSVSAIEAVIHRGMRNLKAELEKEGLG